MGQSWYYTQDRITRITWKRMKIAVLADIHGNLPALAAVAADIAAWNPDAIAVGGDIVNRGPSSAACLRPGALRGQWMASDPRESRRLCHFRRA
jgi:3',5'-cyclic AMP phosphodiesterase CpdA